MNGLKRAVLIRGRDCRRPPRVHAQPASARYSEFKPQRAADLDPASLHRAAPTYSTFR
jgi:hypothetical protein